MPELPPLAPRREPVQARAVAVCEALIEATRRLLERDGPEGATTTRIARLAGVSVGSLYQYYPNREALWHAVYVDHLDRIVRPVVAVFDDAERASVATHAVMDEALGAYLSAKRAEAVLSAAFRDHLRVVDADACVRAATARVVDALSAFLVGRGASRDEASERARLVCGALEGATSHGLAHEPQYARTAAFDEGMRAVAALLYSVLPGGAASAQASSGPSGPATKSR